MIIAGPGGSKASDDGLVSAGYGGTHNRRSLSVTWKPLTDALTGFVFGVFSGFLVTGGTRFKSPSVGLGASTVFWPTPFKITATVSSTMGTASMPINKGTRLERLRRRRRGRCGSSSSSLGAAEAGATGGAAGGVGVAVAAVLAGAAGAGWLAAGVLGVA